MFPPEKLRPRSTTTLQRLTGADYIKPDESRVNIRASICNFGNYSAYSLLALSDVFVFAAAAALGFVLAVPRAVFLCLLGGALSASPGASGLYTIRTRPWRKSFPFNPFHRRSRSGGTPKSSATVSTVSPVCVL